MSGHRKAPSQAPTPSPALAQLVGTLTSQADPATHLAKCRQGAKAGA